jgi:hypothetical protein
VFDVDLKRFRIQDDKCMNFFDDVSVVKMMPAHEDEEAINM